MTYYTLRHAFLWMVMIMSMTAAAVPVKPGLRRVLNLSDGTSITAMLVGDEHGHYWLGDNGQAYQTTDGEVYFAVDAQSINVRAAQRRQQANDQRLRRLAPRRVSQINPVSGQKKGLIILVNYSDVSFKVADNAAYYLRVANEEIFSDGKFKGSMYDYFKAQSSGQFELTFDVVGPYTLSKSMAYYGENKTVEPYDDKHAAEMVIEALHLADPDVDYANYDWNGDGEVEQVYVVYAGKGEADGGAAETIWPHEWTLTSAYYYGDGTGLQTLDGVKLNTYACGGELDGQTGTIAGIGTMCHEFSHCLGFPDFYDTDNNGSQGMGYWDLMASGSYNGDSYQPAGYTSYERWMAGWKAPIELTTTQDVTDMQALQNDGNTYVIYNKGNSNEYFLLENRQKTGWDASIPGSGLLILHVDYNASVWTNNKVNATPTHQRLTWIPADNEYQWATYQGSRNFTKQGMANDPYPYGTNNAFGRSTTPAAELYNKNTDNTYYLDSSVENITQSANGTISFRFNDGTTPTPDPDPEEGDSESDYSDVKTFKHVTSVSNLVSGKRYIIACGSQFTAAGELSNNIFGSESVTVNDDVITIGDDVTIFYVEGNQTDGWTFKKVGEDSYLYSSSAKKLAYSSTANTWELGDGTDGVIMTYGSNGTMLYNVSSPRFTTYTSSPSASMIQANLYMVDPSATPETPEPVIVDDETLVFSTTVGTPQTLPLSVLSEDLTEDITVSLSDPNSVFSVSSSTILRTLTETSIDVTFTPTAAGNFAGTITLSSEGAESAIVAISGTATAVPTPEPVTGNNFTLVTSASDFTEGDYIIVYDNGAMNSTVESNRLQVTAVTPEGNTITTEEASIIWHIAPSGNYCTIYNAATNKYAASNGTKNQAQLTSDGTDDKALWTVTAGETFEFVNKFNAANSVNANLRRNGTYGFACYASATGGALSLYKRSSGSTPDPVIAYYQPADGKQAAALKTAMSGIIYNRTELSYDGLWTAFMTTDVRSDGKIWDTYSNITNYTPVTSGSSYTKEGDCYNREHTFPQSWFGSDAPMYTDLHHIYPTDGFVNGKRANYPFGETAGGNYKSANDFSKLGSCTYPGYTGNVFEPADEYKGDFARTYFYMVTCYEEKLADWYAGNADGVRATIDGNPYPGLQSWQLEMLMKWSKNDPVSEKEVNRNNAVYTLQNNRNPFIDYPGLEEYIWGFMTTSTFSYDNYVQPVYKQDVTMAFTSSEAQATLGESFIAPGLTISPTGLTVTYSSSNTDVAIVDELTGVVTLVAAGTTTITASFAGNDLYNPASASYLLTVSSSEPVVGSGDYELVTDVTTLQAGDKIIIVNNEAAKALSTTQTSNNRSATSVTISNNIITPGESVQIITLEKDGSYFLFNVGNGYLYAASSSSNYMRTETTADDNAKAAITISSTNGDATIVFQGTNTRNHLRYNANSGSPLFSCYASNSTLSLTQIYREIQVPVPADITLENNADNSSVLAANNGKLADVTLNGRTLYKDDAWNTLCLPFNVTSFSGTPLEGATIMEMTNSSYDETGFNAETGVLKLSFNDANAVIAGHAYIIKWNLGTDIVNPVFANVTIDNEDPNDQCAVSKDHNVCFQGNYSPIVLPADVKTNLYMSDANTLYYPLGNDLNLGSFRAYFTLMPDVADEVKSIVMNYGGDEVITTIDALNQSLDRGIISGQPLYDLTGRRVTTPQKGHIYIQNNRKVLW